MASDEVVIQFRGEILRLNEDSTFRLKLSNGHEVDRVPRSRLYIDATAEKQTFEAAIVRRDGEVSHRKLDAYNKKIDAGGSGYEDSIEAHQQHPPEDQHNLTNAKNDFNIENKERSAELEQERMLQSKLQKALNQLKAAEEMAVAKATVIDAEDPQAMASLLIPIAPNKSIQTLHLTPETWQRAMPQLLKGDPKHIARSVVGSTAFFFQRGDKENQRASAIATAVKKSTVVDSSVSVSKDIGVKVDPDATTKISISGDCVLMRQGNTCDVVRIIYHYKRLRLQAQFDDAIALLAAEQDGKKEPQEQKSMRKNARHKEEKGTVALDDPASAKTSIIARRSEQTLQDSTGKHVNASQMQPQQQNRIKKNSTRHQHLQAQWRKDMRERTHLFKQLVPGTRAIIEALPSHRLPRHHQRQYQLEQYENNHAKTKASDLYFSSLPSYHYYWPCAGDFVHVREFPTAPFVQATVIRTLKSGDKTHRHLQEQQEEEPHFELLLARGNVVIRPLSKIVGLPRSQRYFVPVAKVLDLVATKLSSGGRRFSMPCERTILNTFVEDQLQIRPATLTFGQKTMCNSSTLHSSNESDAPMNIKEWTAGSVSPSVVSPLLCPLISPKPIKQHPESIMMPYLKVLSFERYVPDHGHPDDHLVLEVKQTRWQRAIVKSGKLYMLQGFYNGRSLLLNLFSPGTNERASLLLNKYNIEDLTRVPAPLTGINLQQCFDLYSRQLHVVKLHYPMSAWTFLEMLTTGTSGRDVNTPIDRKSAVGAMCIALPNMPWFLQEPQQREEQITLTMNSHHTFQQKTLQEIFMFYQLLCQRVRVRRTWFEIERKRRLRQAANTINEKVLQEWHQMRMADQESAEIRPYLTLPYSQLQELYATFKYFDKDDSDTISAKEFQDMIYEVKGEVLDRKGVKQALKVIDRDKNGVVDFNEFVWWFVAPRGQYPIKHDIGGFFLRLKLDIRKTGRSLERFIATNTAKAQKQQREHRLALERILQAKQTAFHVKERTRQILQQAKKETTNAFKILETRRQLARKRALASLQRSREMAALTTPEEKEAYRVAHLTEEEREKEEELKRIERERISKVLAAEAEKENERVARQLLEEQEAKAKAKQEAEAKLLQDQIEAAKQRAAIRKAKQEEAEAEAKRQQAAVEARIKEEAAKAEIKAKRDKRMAERIESERLSRRAAAMENMTTEERKAAEKKEAELQLQRKAEEKMKLQLEAQKVMQKKLERADRARRRAEKEKKKKAKAAKKKQVGKEKRKREILAKRASAKK